MSSTGNLKKRYFPSYKQIEQSILNEHKKQHQSKVEDLQRKIRQLQGSFNLQKEHEEIKRKLLQNYHSSSHELMKNILGQLNDDEEKLQKEAHTVQWGSGGSNYANQNSTSNSYSLNYCIDEDVEEDNHYENHLKFKKQVLQRDLFENMNVRNDKKKLRDQEFIFKNLYNPKPNIAFSFSYQEKLKPSRKAHNNYMLSDNKQFKQNFKNSKKKFSSISSSNISSNLHQDPRQKQTKFLSKKCVRKQPEQDQFMEQHNICQKNTKTLKDSYGKYLKELSGTNIIKWRILGGQRFKQSVSSSINSTNIGNKNLEIKQILRTLD